METPSTPQEKTRYSAEELHEFKELILKKIAEAKRNLELLNQAVAGSENDVRDTSHTIMTIDDGQEVLAKEENSKLAARQMRFIKDLEAALCHCTDGSILLFSKTRTPRSRRLLHSKQHPSHRRGIRRIGDRRLYQKSRKSLLSV